MTQYRKKKIKKSLIKVLKITVKRSLLLCITLAVCKLCNPDPPFSCVLDTLRPKKINKTKETGNSCNVPHSDRFLRDVYLQNNGNQLLRESDTRISTSGFFHKSMAPRPLSITLGSFRIFSKIRGDNREWMFITGVNDIGEKREKFWNKNF